MVTDIAWQFEFLSSEECYYIIDLHKDKEFTRSKFQAKPIPDVDIQRQISTEVEIDTSDERMREILDRIKEYVMAVNEHQFYIDVDFDCVKMKLIRMDAEEKGFISTHQKVNWLTRDKHNKIFACVNLSDSTLIEGSEQMLLAFWSTPPTLQERRKQGTLLVYPSTKRTEYTPILKGTRYILCIDYMGPCWK